MKPYLVIHNFYYDGELEKARSTTLLLEKPFHKIYEGASFDGLCDLIKEHGTIIPFEIIKRKNDKRFLWHYDKIFGWITPKNITLETDYYMCRNYFDYERVNVV